MKQLLILFALLLMTSAAWAAKPVTYTFEYPAPGGFIADCGDFDVLDDAYIVEQWKDFYDNESNLIRSQIHFTAVDNLYRDDDPDGTRLTGTANLNVRMTTDGNGDEIWAQQGIAIAIVVPGYGPVFMDVGKLVYNMSNDWELIFSAGRNHDWNFGDFEALCNYFAQD